MSKPYDMTCPVAQALDIIGERWSLLILRDLILFGPRRFQDFQDSLDGIAPNTLSKRLKLLEEKGVVMREYYEKHPPRAENLLTEKGAALKPVLNALKDWGEAHGDC